MSIKLVLRAGLPVAAAFLLSGCFSDPLATTDRASSSSTNNAQAAAVVIGQSGFTGNESNQGGTADANTIAYPYGNPGVLNGRLYLPDFINNRLLGFNGIPTVNNTTANFVLGQPDFTSTTAGAPSSTTLNGPKAVAFDTADRMFLTDYNNNRVLIWNTAPTAGGVAADIAVGQSNLTNIVDGCTATNLNLPESVWAVGANGPLIVSDTGNNRVLIWNTVPGVHGAAASVVLGQQNFTSCVKNDSDSNGFEDLPSAATLSAPAGVWSDGTRLVVLDSGNNRVLIWNTFPSSNADPANIVLGQSSFTRNAFNDDNQDDHSENSASARTLNFPYGGVYSNGQKLFITDSKNNRVLVWDSFPTADFTPADRVLGQEDFTLWAANDDNRDGARDTAPTAKTLDNPSGVFLQGSQLIVSDSVNSRYLIYNGQ